MARLPLSSLLSLVLALQSEAPAKPSPLDAVKTWLIQFQKLESSGAVDALAASSYDLLVVEPTGTYRSAASFDMATMVATLRKGRKGRLVLAYLDLAEADSNRSYWQKSWTPPSATRPGTPDFLLKPDPDGWKDTYVVCYTDPRWKEILRADLARILRAGFDGLYLDWVGAYEDDAVAARIKAGGRDPAQEMLGLLGEVRRDAAPSRGPDRDSERALPARRGSQGRGAGRRRRLRKHLVLRPGGSRLGQ